MKLLEIVTVTGKVRNTINVVESCMRSLMIFFFFVVGEMEIYGEDHFRSASSRVLINELKAGKAEIQNITDQCQVVQTRINTVIDLLGKVFFFCVWMEHRKYISNGQISLCLNTFVAWSANMATIVFNMHCPMCLGKCILEITPFNRYNIFYLPM